MEDLEKLTSSEKKLIEAILEKERQKETEPKEPCECKGKRRHDPTYICTCVDEPTDPLVALEQKLLLDFAEYEEPPVTPPPPPVPEPEPVCECPEKLQSKHLPCICEREPSCTWIFVPYEFEQVTVNFDISGRYLFSKLYWYETNILQIKNDISNKYGIPVEFLQIMHYHVFQQDCSVLRYIKTDPGNEMSLTIVNTSNLRPPALEINVIPDIITVHIEHQDITKTIVVEIENRAIEKPYLGGYIDRETSLEYHHAFSQTGPPPERVEPWNKNTRDTQTKWLRNRLLEQSYSRATQMSNENIFITTMNDKILTAGKYETAEEYYKRIDIERNVIIIQRYFRAWKTRMALKAYHLEYVRRVESERQENLEIQLDQERFKRQEVMSKVFPRSRDDFAMLYSMVDRWKKVHIARISKIEEPSVRLAEFYMLLKREIELLMAIEKQRQRLKNDIKISKEIKFFHDIGDPIKWKGYKDITVAMDTLETQQGRVYKTLYYTLCDRKIPAEERLNFITQLRDELKSHNCQIANEIINLLNREIEMINHNIDPDKMDLLRKRIEALVLKHIKTPECNKGVTRRLLKLKEEEIGEDSYFCPRCNTIKSYKQFPPINCTDLRMRSCLSCTWYDVVAEPWIDITLYRYILRCIRREERKLSCHNSVAFLMQEKDIHYIINRIWHAESALSECRDLSKLRLVRWNRDEEWSPWNCILLTEDEAKAHMGVENLERIYHQQFRDFIRDRHMLGRTIFSNCILLNKYFRNQLDNYEFDPTPPPTEWDIIPKKFQIKVEDEGVQYDENDIPEEEEINEKRETKVRINVEGNESSN